MSSIEAREPETPLTLAFSSGLLEGWSLEETLCFASAVGASCTRALGATAGRFHVC